MEAAKIMIGEAKEFGYLEEYKEELEYSFTLLHYINTLFTYMVGVKPVKISFIKKMGKELKDYFPDFQKNTYYCQRTNEEEKKLITLQQKSTLFFKKGPSPQSHLATASFFYASSSAGAAATSMIRIRVHLPPK